MAETDRETSERLIAERWAADHDLALVSRRTMAYVLEPRSAEHATQQKIAAELERIADAMEGRHRP